MYCATDSQYCGDSVIYWAQERSPPPLFPAIPQGGNIFNLSMRTTTYLSFHSARSLGASLDCVCVVVFCVCCRDAEHCPSSAGFDLFLFCFVYPRPPISRVFLYELLKNKFHQTITRQLITWFFCNCACLFSRRRSPCYQASGSSAHVSHTLFVLFLTY